MTPLHYVGELLRQTLQEIPLFAVRLLFVASLVGLLVWVIRLPRSVTCSPDGAPGLSSNLKLGACLALLIQIMIYMIL